MWLSRPRVPGHCYSRLVRGYPGPMFLVIVTQGLFVVVQAPCEAEAQCAALVKAGTVYATGTEDMDALTFGSKVLLRHLTFSEARYNSASFFPANQSMFQSMFYFYVCLHQGDIRPKTHKINPPYPQKESLKTPPYSHSPIHLTILLKL